MTSTPIVYPSIFYKDCHAAMAWLERAFGFQQLMAVPGPDGEVIHGEMHFQGAIVFVGSERASEGYVSIQQKGRMEAAISIGVSDAATVDAVYQKAKAAGAEILREPHSTDYQERGFDCYDPEGHYWGFGTYRPTVVAN